MQLDVMNKITEKVDEIKNMLNPEDAYYVCDVIISNINDEEMPELVKEILDRNGYTEDKMKEVLTLVLQIQEIVAQD